LFIEAGRVAVASVEQGEEKEKESEEEKEKKRIAIIFITRHVSSSNCH
jgi:hypothetical protein